MLSEKPWNFNAALRLLFGLFASILIGMVAVSWLQWNSGPSGSAIPSFRGFIVGAITFHGVGLLLIHALLREHQISWAAAFGFNSPRLGRALLLAIIVGIAVLPITLSLNQLSAQLLRWAHLKPQIQPSIETLHSIVSVKQKIFFGIVAIIVAPTVEEFIFRGILYPTIKQQGYPRLALWGTSLFFALIHNTPMIFVPLTFLALILTLLYENTNNLLAPIVTHSLFNAANFFWLVYLR